MYYSRGPKADKIIMTISYTCELKSDFKLQSLPLVYEQSVHNFITRVMLKAYALP